MNESPVQWLIDGNNVFGSRPDGWWNDRPATMVRFTQHVAEWCRGHDEPVTVVFDLPVPDDALDLAGGNLDVRAAERRGANAADDLIVVLAREAEPAIRVVSSDRGLRARLPDNADVVGVGAFRDLIGY